MRFRYLGPVILALAAASAAGCGKKDPILRLRDSEGRKLLAKCGEEGCVLKQQGGPTWPAGQPALLLKRTGLLVAVCNAPDGAQDVTDVRACRPLECADDRECPPEPGAPKGHCINGLCEEPAGNLTADDAIVLCLAGKGLGTGSNEQVEAHALGLNCGSPCVVPRSCKQP